MEVTGIRTPTASESQTADTYDAIRPLVELCKTGKLFAVQEWIATGKPVNPPKPTGRHKSRSPLDVAMDLGFHSLIQVLLDAGATYPREAWNSPLYKALEMKRLDIIELLIEHGENPATIDMMRVFETWDPVLMEYFIQRGAELERGYPLAYALCHRIRTALSIYKRYRERFSSFQKQIDIALRHHCKEGNLKWVSLLLWAGADPYAEGPAHWETDPEEGEHGICALAYAALYEHFAIFKLKFRFDPKHPVMYSVARYCQRSEGIEILKRILEGGLPPNDLANGGSSMIQGALRRMRWCADYGHWGNRFNTEKKDNAETRSLIQAVHLVAQHGGRWIPEDKAGFKDARSSLLKLTADYTLEFVWIMGLYQACSKDHILELLRTPAMKAHVSDHTIRLRKLLSVWN